MSNEKQEIKLFGHDALIWLQKNPMREIYWELVNKRHTFLSRYNPKIAGFETKCTETKRPHQMIVNKWFNHMKAFGTLHDLQWNMENQKIMEIKNEK